MRTSRSVSKPFTMATPMMKTATPTCASCMPYQEAELARSLPRSVACGAAFRRPPNCTAVARITQKARKRPSATRADHLPLASGTMTAQATATPSAHFRRVARSGSSAFFQLAIGPMAMRNTAGAMSGKNTASK